MRRRLDIAISIITEPKILFLDEPTTGLDPSSRNTVWDILDVMVKGGMTIILTTQYLEEADRLASRIAVIDNGLIIADDTAASLKKSIGNGALHIQVEGAETNNRLRTYLQDTSTQSHAMKHQLGYIVVIESPLAAINLMRDVLSAGITPTDFFYKQPSLDEVFLALTGKKETSNEAK